ncbi:hypothetical protein [Actinocrinis sp.]|uniref:hypothetical protein n=1 Tax=Actinocrinis sp. TaxID=1920516 RepID=UPI002D45A7A9|nr:hypothetical protein [Actinocrinis sp.]HZP55020.1 hypothetical protein [Actinocrinis sp.]
MLAATGTALALAVLMLMLFLILKLGRASDQIGALNTADQARDRAIAALATGDNQLRSQVLKLGGTPNVPPPQVIISSIPGATGQQGPGPSDAQVAAAVAAYLVAHPVPGVSTEQITSAVTAYLIASPPPSGAPGPGPSDQQVASAVAAYMSAHPAPAGPAGPAGRDGQNGVNGSPPAGWSFEADGVTYNCVPDNGTPAPHYTCPPEPSASASPTPPPTPPNSASPTAGTPTPTPTASSATTPAAVASTPASFATLIGGPVHEAGDAGRRAFVLLGVPLYRRGL